jgi:hypothetical protein
VRNSQDALARILHPGGSPDTMVLPLPHLGSGRTAASCCTSTAVSVRTDALSSRSDGLWPLRFGGLGNMPQYDGVGAGVAELADAQDLKGSPRFFHNHQKLE